MLVSFATRCIANQALPATELKAERVQSRQRETGNLYYRHLHRLWARHPERQLRQRAIRLVDDQGDFIAMTPAPHRPDHFATTGMKAVTDRHLFRLIVSIMSLLRRRPEWSSVDRTLRPRVRF